MSPGHPTLTPTAGPPTPLGSARPGQRVVVREVTGADALARRLVDLGFLPGVEVQVLHVAPLGSPVSYRLHGYRLALRRAEADRVLVEGLSA